MESNKSPNMIRQWDSRFTECTGERHFQAFRRAYSAKVRPALEAKLNRLMDSKEKTISAVADSRRLCTDMNTEVVKNGTSKEKLELVTTLYANLAKSEEAEMAAEARVESHQSEMEDTLEGRIDPEYRDWIRNIDMITKSNQASKADFKGELDKRFDTPDNVWWVEFRNGANRKSKELAYEICHVMAYYDQVFSEANLSKIFGVQPENHNTKLALEKLSDLRILRKTTDDEGSEVYKFVNMLQMHLKYESNERIERRIGKDLKRLYKEGRAIITARSEKKRKTDDNGDDERNSNNDGQADDGNDASSDRDDDSNNEGKSDSEVEEDDDDSDVGKSARGKDEEEDVSIVEL